MAKRPGRPVGASWLSPYLVVSDADAALDFYQRAFGFARGIIIPGPDGRTAHAEMRWQDARFAFGPGKPGQASSPAASGVPSPVRIEVYCEDVDDLFARATAAGATVISPPQDMFWGDRVCRLADPDGHEWSFATNVADFDPARAQAAVEQESPPRAFCQPAWDGSPLDGRRILLYAEQGLGDTIQFVRYARPVQERGGVVILECQPALRRLLAGCPGVDRLVPHGAPLPEFNVRARLMGLPEVLDGPAGRPPADVPYLRAEPERQRRWRRQLGEAPAFSVGIIWQGNPNYPLDRERSAPLARFAPLAGVQGVSLFSLQKGSGTEQLAAAGFPVTDLGGRLDRGPEAFLDTAAVLVNLNLVVTVDTAVAHLAGALGVPVWLALPVAAHWRWGLEAERTAWYPTIRLFRQTAPGDWEGVFARMAESLRRQVTSV